MSTQVIDYAERLSNMADAAEGKRRHTRQTTRWLLLPVSGAAAYAFLKSDFFSRRAKDLVEDARTRAAELPDDLMTRVRQATDASAGQDGSRRRSSTSGSSRTNSRRRTSSTRKAKSTSA
jgi:hypothetical protein